MQTFFEITLGLLIGILLVLIYKQAGSQSNTGNRQPVQAIKQPKSQAASLDKMLNDKRHVRFEDIKGKR